MLVFMPFLSVKLGRNLVEISHEILVASMPPHGGCMTQAGSLGCFNAHEFLVCSLKLLYFAILNLLNLILLIFIIGKCQKQRERLPSDLT